MKLSKKSLAIVLASLTLFSLSPGLFGAIAMHSRQGGLVAGKTRYGTRYDSYSEKTAPSTDTKVNIREELFNFLVDGDESGRSIKDILGSSETGDGNRRFWEVFVRPGLERFCTRGIFKEGGEERLDSFLSPNLFNKELREFININKRNRIIVDSPNVADDIVEIYFNYQNSKVSRAIWNEIFKVLSDRYNKYWSEKLPHSISDIFREKLPVYIEQEMDLTDRKFLGKLLNKFDKETDWPSPEDFEKKLRETCCELCHVNTDRFSSSCYHDSIIVGDGGCINEYRWARYVIPELVKRYKELLSKTSNLEAGFRNGDFVKPKGVSLDSWKKLFGQNVKAAFKIRIGDKWYCVPYLIDLDRRIKFDGYTYGMRHEERKALRSAFESHLDDINLSNWEKVDDQIFLSRVKVEDQWCSLDGYRDEMRQCVVCIDKQIKEEEEDSEPTKEDAFLSTLSKSPRHLVSEIFEIKPFTWGFRGDPQLWDKLHDRFARIPIDGSFDEREFKQLLDDTICDLCERPRGGFTEDVYVKDFDNGGASGGFVCHSRWREFLIPMLVEKYRAIRGCVLLSSVSESSSAVAQQTVDTAGIPDGSYIKPKGVRAESWKKLFGLGTTSAHYVRFGDKKYIVPHLLSQIFDDDSEKWVCKIKFDGFCYGMSIEERIALLNAFGNHTGDKDLSNWEVYNDPEITAHPGQVKHLGGECEFDEYVENIKKCESCIYTYIVSQIMPKYGTVMSDLICKLPASTIFAICDKDYGSLELLSQDREIGEYLCYSAAFSYDEFKNLIIRCLLGWEVSPEKPRSPLVSYRRKSPINLSPWTSEFIPELYKTYKCHWEAAFGKDKFPYPAKIIYLISKLSPNARYIAGDANLDLLSSNLEFDRCICGRRQLEYHEFYNLVFHCLLGEEVSTSPQRFIPLTIESKRPGAHSMRIEDLNKVIGELYKAYQDDYQHNLYVSGYRL